MIRNEIVNFISNSFSNPTQVPFVNSMMNSELSLHNRGATTIQTDYNPAGDSQPHDICRSQTYIYQPFPRILQNMNGFAPPESTVVHRPTLSQTVL